MTDEHYVDAASWQFRVSFGPWQHDRGFWSTSGGWHSAIGFGIVNDFGEIVRTEARPSVRWYE